jgi:uncharacterized membrane protein YphA (DoxX/SURF4 family)
MNVSSAPAGFARSRSWALGALAVAIAAQLIWFARTVRQEDGPDLVRPAIFTAVMGLLALTRGRTPFVVALARIVIGGAFLNALWNRFDDFSRFVAYTGQVNAFLPAEVIPFLAVAATVLECIFAAAMLLGIAIPWAAAGSAVLLFLFATAMVASGLDQFEWAVYVLAAGAWVVAASGARLLTVDSLLTSAPDSALGAAREELRKSDRS